MALLLLAQTEAVPPQLIAPLASAGGLGLLVWFMHIQLGKADQRAANAEARADAAVASERALRDTILKDVVPAMTRMNDVATRQLEAWMRGER